MIIQAELKRKQSEYKGEACAVDKVIELPTKEWCLREPEALYDFIRDECQNPKAATNE